MQFQATTHALCPSVALAEAGKRAKWVRAECIIRSGSHSILAIFFCEPHVEFGRRQTRTQPPPHGPANAGQRSGLTNTQKPAAVQVVCVVCDPTGNRTRI